MPNRRLLLQGMGGVILAAGTATAASAASPLERVRLMKSYIVNLADDALVSDALALGAPLALTREPQRCAVLTQAPSLSSTGICTLDICPATSPSCLPPWLTLGSRLRRASSE
jgi:hypothetical protein